MSYSKFHIKYTIVNQETFNKHLLLSKNYKTLNYSYKEFKELNKPTQRFTRFIKNNRLNITLTYKLGPKWISIKTNKAKEYDKVIEQPVDPIKAYSNFARIVKPKKYKFNIPNLGPYRDNHKDKKGKYDYAICYDVNKSFFNACNNKMPLKLIAKMRAPKKGEVGFLMSGIPVIGPAKYLCIYVFTLGKHEGLEKYCKIQSKKLLTNESKTKAEINESIGNLANHNPFLRNMIVWYSNEFIKSKVDENTIWSNTDSIISTVKRDDLVVGNKVGQFKIEHEGKFIQSITGYEWIDENIYKNSGISRDQIKLYNKTHDKRFVLGETDRSELKDMLLWEFNEKKEILYEVHISK